MRRRFGFGAPIVATVAVAMAAGLGFAGCNDTSSTTTVNTPGPASTPAAVPAGNPGAPDGPPHGGGWGGSGGNGWPCEPCESGYPNQEFVGWQFTLVIVNVQVFTSCTNDLDAPDNGSEGGQTTYLTDDGPAHFDSAPTDIEWCTLSYQDGSDNKDQWQAGQQFQFDVSSESAQQSDDGSSDTVSNVDFSADADAGGVPLTIECHFPEQLPAGTLPVTKVNQLLGKAAQVSNPAPSPSPSPSPSSGSGE